MKTIKLHGLIDNEGRPWILKVYKTLPLSDFKFFSAKPQEKIEISSLEPIAFEWHNAVTGHCYVDYVPHKRQGETEGYTKTLLYRVKSKYIDKKDNG